MCSFYHYYSFLFSSFSHLCIFTFICVSSYVYNDIDTLTFPSSFSFLQPSFFLLFIAYLLSCSSWLILFCFVNHRINEANHHSKVTLFLVFPFLSSPLPPTPTHILDLFSPSVAAHSLYTVSTAHSRPNLRHEREFVACTYGTV